MNHESGGGGRLPRLDLAAIRASADLVSIVGRYGQVRKHGKEHQTVCPFHADSDPSLNLYTKGGVDRFICFACGAKGDALDFVSRIEGVDVIEAARIISGDMGPIAPIERKPPPPPEWVAILPVPASAPKMNPRELWNPNRAGSRNKDGTPYTGTSLRALRTDPYFDAAGALLGYVLRCEIDGSKWTPTVTYCAHRETGECRWVLQAFAEPRPMQGLDALAAKPAATVLVVSGEKCRAVASTLFPAFAVVTWPGGDNGFQKCDLSPLNSRQVTFWPDCDASGINAMREIASRLSGSLVRFLDVSSLRAEFGKGADVADVAEAWPQDRVLSWCRANVAAGIPAEAVDEPREVRAEMVESGVDDHSENETVASAQTASQSENETIANEEAAPAPILGSDPGGSTVREGDSDGASADAAETDSSTDDASNATGSDQTADEPLEVAPKRGRKPKNAELVDSPKPSASYESLATWSALGLTMSDKGIPHPNLDNAARIVERHVELRGHFWFDEFLQRILSTWNADNVPREWTDTDDVRLTLWMQRRCGMGKMATGTARDAVTAVAMSLTRNECRDWLESLEWDGTDRLDQLCIAGFGAEDDLAGYHRAVGRTWVVSMVARVLRPGCKVDTMPVFEGPQGLRKSSAIERLVGSHWFAESAEDPKKNDFFLTLVGKLVVEVGEMASFNRAEKETIKRVISCKVDRYRAPYGRRSEDHPRMGVFAGSTNKRNWNSDETGARRFLPVACTAIDLAWIETNREQLFAEAVARFERGESWWDVPADEASKQQEGRRDGDAWELVIGDWLSLNPRAETTTAEIMSKALELSVERWDKATQMRIATCLDLLGWERKTVWRGGKAVKAWVQTEAVRGGNDIL